MANGREYTWDAVTFNLNPSVVTTYQPGVRQINKDLPAAGNKPGTFSYVTRQEIKLILENDLWGLDFTGDNKANISTLKNAPKTPSYFSKFGEPQLLLIIDICKAMKGNVKWSSKSRLGEIFRRYFYGEVLAWKDPNSDKLFFNDPGGDSIPIPSADGFLGGRKFDNLIEATGFRASSFVDKEGSRKEPFPHNSYGSIDEKTAFPDDVWKVSEQAIQSKQSLNKNRGYGPIYGLMSNFLLESTAFNRMINQWDNPKSFGTVDDAVTNDAFARGKRAAELQEGALAKLIRGESITEEERQQLLQQMGVKAQRMLTFDNNLKKIVQYNRSIRGYVNPEYKRVLMIDGEPYKLMNVLTYKKHSDEFTNITVPEVSSLVPMIKMSKLIYNSKGERQGQIPFVFDTFTKIQSADALNAGRSGVGIKSFDWQLNGTNVVAAKSDITAKLVLYFQSFDELLKVNENGFKYVDLLIRQDPPTSEDKEVDERNTQKESKKLNTDSKFYEIQATVGWAYNNDYILDYENKTKLNRALKTQRRELILTLVGHTFDIQQDGTYTLSIDYRGRMSANMKDSRASIIFDKETKERLSALSQTLSNIKENLDGAERESNNNVVIESTEQVAEDVEKQITNLKTRGRIQAIQAFTSYLLRTNRMFYASIQRRDLIRPNANASMFDFEKMPPGRLGLDLSKPGIGTNVAQGTEFLRKLQNAATKELIVNAAENESTGILAAETNLDVNTINATNLEKEIEDGSVVANLTNLKGQVYNAANGRFFTGEDKITTDDAISVDPFLEGAGLIRDEETFYIPWFYLGDLIDFAAERAFGSLTTDELTREGGYYPSRSENMKIILGGIKMPPDRKNKKSFLLNIGDIPVSYSLFRQFINKKIVFSERDDYSLDNFIKDCMKNFIVNSLFYKENSSTRERSLVPRNNSISIKTSKKSKKPKDPIKEKYGLLQPSKERFGKFDLGDGKFVGIQFAQMSIENNSRIHLNTMKRDFISSSPASGDQFFDYKIYYMQSKQADHLQGDPVRDRENGILHFYMGRDRGLIKSVSFERVGIEGQREQRVVERNKLNPLNHLADLYNVDLTMVGNTLFFPGQYIFFNPLGLGAKLGKPTNPNSVSRVMGLGGYHLVTKVESYIENGKYETKIKAMYETSGGPGAAFSFGDVEEEEQPEDADANKIQLGDTADISSKKVGT